MTANEQAVLQDQGDDEAAEKPFWQPALGRGLVVLAAVATGAAIIHFTPLRDYWHNVGKAAAYLHNAGPLGAVIFIAAAVVGMTIGCPRMAVCMVGGMAYGFWEGIILAQTATTLGAYLTFILVRWCGRGFIERHWPKAVLLSKKVRARGVTAVLLLRQLPIHTMVINITLGLTRLHHRDFLVGTVIGTLPESIPFTLLGTGVVSVSAGRSASYILAGVILLVVGGILLARNVKLIARPDEMQQDIAAINPAAISEDSERTL